LLVPGLRRHSAGKDRSQQGVAGLLDAGDEGRMSPGECPGRDLLQCLEPGVGGPADDHRIAAARLQAEHPTGVTEINGVDTEPFATWVESHDRSGGGAGAGRGGSPLP